MEIEDIIAAIADGDPAVLERASRPAPKKAKKLLGEKHEFKDLSPRKYSYRPVHRAPEPQAKKPAWSVTDLSADARRRFQPEAFASATYEPRHFLGISPAF